VPMTSSTYFSPDGVVTSVPGTALTFGLWPVPVSKDNK
jgi:hypothetical protein